MQGNPKTKTEHHPAKYEVAWKETRAYKIVRVPLLTAGCIGGFP
jgi:hypothetical protein